MAGHLLPRGAHYHRRFISQAGTLVGPAFTSSQTPSASYNPLTVAFDGTNYGVIWNHDIRPGYPSGAVWNLNRPLVSRSGTFARSELVLITDSGEPMLPVLASDGSCYLFSYVDNSTSSSAPLSPCLSAIRKSPANSQMSIRMTSMQIALQLAASIS